MNLTIRFVQTLLQNSQIFFYSVKFLCMHPWWWCLFRPYFCCQVCLSAFPASVIGRLAFRKMISQWVSVGNRFSQHIDITWRFYLWELYRVNMTQQMFISKEMVVTQSIYPNQPHTTGPFNSFSYHFNVVCSWNHLIRWEVQSRNVGCQL